MSGRAATLLIGAVLLAAGGCAKITPVTRVVLVTFDTTRADRIGCYGYEEGRTPNLDAFAAGGVLFDNAVSQVPTTLPSHATMFTGQFPQDHGVRYNIFYSLDESAKTLAESLQAAGFATAGFPASQVVAAAYGLNQGFDHYVDPPAEGEGVPGHHGMRSATEGVDLTLDWLANSEADKSFVWLHLYDPHWPYTPPFPYSSEFRERRYDGEIAYADAEFGRLLDTLEQDPAWERTLVIVAGDHGEGLYEHDERWHTILLYETTQHVPLIVGAPGATAGRVDTAVTLADLMPTVLDLTGVNAPGEMRGRSWRPALEGRSLTPRDVYFESLAGSLIYGWAELHGIRYGRWKLIDSSEPELFDLDSDPGETENLADVEPQRVADLRAALEELKIPLKGGSGASSSAEIEIDPETRAMFESLGYTAGGGGSAAGAPNPRDLIFLEPELLNGQNAVAARDWKGVEEFCKYTLERDGTNKWALINMSKALDKLDRYDEAIQHAELFIGVYPESAMGYDTKANIQMGRKEKVEALETLRAGMSREALSSSELLRYKALVVGFDLAATNICSEQVPSALARHAKSGRMHVLQARCRIRDGDTKGALASLQLASEIGFTRIAELAKTDDFAGLSEHPTFIELTGGSDSTGEGSAPPVDPQ